MSTNHNTTPRIVPLSEIEKERRRIKILQLKNKLRKELEAVSRYAQFRLRGLKYRIEFDEDEEGIFVIIKVLKENWEKI